MDGIGNIRRKTIVLVTYNQRISVVTCSACHRDFLVNFRCAIVIVNLGLFLIGKFRYRLLREAKFLAITCINISGQTTNLSVIHGVACLTIDC